MLFVAVLSVELALKFTAVAEKLAVPAPLTEDPVLKLKVPPEKFSVAPEAAAKPAASVPPPEKFSCVPVITVTAPVLRSEEHTSELHSRQYIVCRLLLANKN